MKKPAKPDPTKAKPSQSRGYTAKMYKNGKSPTRQMGYGKKT